MVYASKLKRYKSGPFETVVGFELRAPCEMLHQRVNPTYPTFEDKHCNGRGEYLIWQRNTKIIRQCEFWIPIELRTIMVPVSGEEEKLRFKVKQPQILAGSAGKLRQAKE